jgi:hypothetical protein
VSLSVTAAASSSGGGAFGEFTLLGLAWPGLAGLVGARTVLRTRRRAADVNHRCISSPRRVSYQDCFEGRNASLRP